MTGVIPPPPPLIKPNDPIKININKAVWTGKLIGYSDDGRKAVVKYDSGTKDVIGIDQIEPAYDANDKPSRNRRSPYHFSEIEHIAQPPKRKEPLQSMTSPPSKKQKKIISHT